MPPTRGRAETVTIERFGTPAVFVVRSLPVPEAGPDEVLIELHVAGVGIWDARIRDGTWANGEEEFPLVLGTDGAGYIVAKGSRVRRFELGDRVWAYQYKNPKGGFYAEYVAVHVRNVARAPRRLDLLQAGAGAVTGLTALQGIDDHLDVGRRDRVLVFGAAGAVGSLAVQFAKWRRAGVIAAVRGQDAADLAKRLGADATIDTRADDFEEALDRLAPDGLDAILATSGGDALEACLDHVRLGGRVAYPNGVEPEPTRRPKVKLIAYDAIAGPREWHKLDRAVTEARLQVPIAAAYPLGQVARAHQRLEKGHVVGRIALRIRSARAMQP